MRYHALIPAAGAGERFGAQCPKQYSLLDGKPVLLHAIERLLAGLPLHRTYVLLADDDQWFDGAIGRRDGVTALRCGGPTRSATVRNALALLSEVADDDWIVVHDAVRPCVDVASIVRLREELADESTGGLLAIPIACSLKRIDGANRVTGTQSRDGLWRAQTPQMFRYAVMREAFAQPGIETMTDDAQVIEAFGRQPKLVVGSANNLKITYADDLVLARAILSTQVSGGT